MKIIYRDGSVAECPQEEELEVIRHTAAHIMAQAIKRLYPQADFGYGPATEKGFFYDVDLGETKLTDEDLPAIEKEMQKIVKENLPIKPFILPRDEAIALMQSRNARYKVEHIGDLSQDAVISFYQQGEYIDMCTGPHLCYTKALKAFKLTQQSGAYWKNDKNNKMLTRINGVAFRTVEDLNEFVQMQQEAERRDHNKLGRELEYFTTVDVIGQGLPVLLPKGARVVQLLQRWVEDVEQKHGYLLTKTPLMAKRDLYRISGHWDHYRDGMFIMGDAEDETKECLALRPMTCPFQYQVYLNQSRSYRDLPMRLGETSTLFRNEDSGEMHGLIRVRQFTISEGHLVLRPDQLEQEFRDCLNLSKYFLGTVGLLENCTFRFSQWDPNNTQKYEGTPEQWDTAQSIMAQILADLDVPYTIGIDEAAFYGPKLDIQYKNVFGKEDTIVTIQIDMLLAAKFGMYYTDQDGQKKLPYIIHRTSLGCYERTLAYLIERYAGALPTWMSPEQVRVLTITDRAADYGRAVSDALDKADFRVQLDDSSNTLRYKIRAAQVEKVPFMLILGDKDMEQQTVSVRHRSGKDYGSMPLADFVEMLSAIVREKQQF